MMDQSRVKRGWALVAIAAATAAIWLVLLPWWAQRPGMQRHLGELERRGVDGGAMYYTELPMMESLLRRLER